MTELVFLHLVPGQEVGGGQGPGALRPWVAGQPGSAGGSPGAGLRPARAWVSNVSQTFVLALETSGEGEQDFQLGGHWLKYFFSI